MKYKSQLIGVCTMLIASAALIYYASSVEAVNSISTVTVQDTTYEVPMDVQDLLDAGYSIMACDYPTLTKFQSNVTYFTNSKGHVVTTDVRTRKETDEVQNGVIVDILVDKGNTLDSELAVQGISFDSTEEEVKEVFGEPIFDLGGDTLYVKHIRDNGVDMVSVLMTNGDVVRLEVCNTKGYDPEE